MATIRPIIPEIEKAGVENVRRRFESKTRHNPETGCLEWMAKRDPRGYGGIVIARQTYRAHRVSYALAHGVDPGELFVCHACDNPPCVNPAHLWLGTVGDNTRDMCAKGRKPDHNCERNPRAKLTPDQVRAIRVDARGCKKLARAYGVHRATIQDIRNGTNWSLLK